MAAPLPALSVDAPTAGVETVREAEPLGVQPATADRRKRQNNTDLLWSIKTAVVALKALRKTAVAKSSGAEQQQHAASDVPKSETEQTMGFDKDGEDTIPDWDLLGWINSLRLGSLFEQMISRPLQEHLAEENLHFSSEAEKTRFYNQANLEFILSLGQMPTHEPMARLLADAEVTDHLAKRLWQACKKLREENDQYDVAEGRTNKFFEDGSSSLTYGDLTTFFRGLDGFIGPPSPNLSEAMENEHCGAADHAMFFTVPNYKTRTTPELEYWFVADPSAEQLAALRDKYPAVEEWPREVVLPHDAPPAARAAPAPAPPAEGMAGAPGLAHQGSMPEEQTSRARRPLPPSHFEQLLEEKNGLLLDDNHAPLILEEMLGARLYTGPMYVKYNTILRDVGTLSMRRDKGKGHLSENETIEGLKGLNDERRRFTADPESPEEVAQFNARCTHGNLYTTTLHLINSAVIKMGKLARAGSVFRGIARRTLPREMMRKNEYNYRGGIEFGFTSTSEKRHEAMLYAHQGGGGGSSLAMLMEMEMGMVDRGADLSWLSQYPHEKEVLFPPLTGLELLEHHVEDAMLVVTVRPSVNLNSLTIEQVLSKMQDSHLQLLDLLTDNLQFAGVPREALQPLMGLRQEASQREAAWFNSSHHYKRATEDAIDRQSEVFRRVAKSAESGCLPEPGKLQKIAALAARADDQGTVIELLLLKAKAARRDTGDGGAGGPGKPALLEEIARAILEEGCMQPWPATFLALANESKAFKDAVIPQRRLKVLLKSCGKSHTRHFARGAQVRVCMDNVNTWRWEHARVLAGPREDEPEQDKKKERYKASGVQYQVQLDGGGLPVWQAEELVVSHSENGLPAVLHQAAIQGDHRMVRLLVEAKVSPYVTDKGGNNALLLAALHATEQKEADYAKVIDFFCNKHSDFTSHFIHMRNCKRQSVFDVMVSRRLGKMVRAYDPTEVDALITEEYAQNNVEALGDDGTMVEETPLEDDIPPLMLACCASKCKMKPRSRAKQVVANMLAAGHSASCTHSATGLSALHVAAEEGDEQVVDMLLNKGAEVDARDKKGNTPFMYAAKLGNTSVCKLLIEGKADFTLLVKDKSALDKAAMYGHKDTCKLLLERAAKREKEEGIKEGKLLLNRATSKSYEGLMALTARYGHHEVCELLLGYGVSIEHELQKPFWTSLHRACANGFNEFARTLLNSEYGKAIIDHASGEKERGTTALMVAAASGYSDTVRMLLEEFGADPTKTNLFGKPVLLLAAEAGQADVVKILLSNPAVNVDGTVTTAKGETTPLLEAVKKAHADTVRVLLAHGAKSAGNEEKGQPDALLEATRRGNPKIVRLLAESMRINQDSVDRQKAAQAEAKRMLQELNAQEENYAMKVETLQKVEKVLSKRIGKGKKVTLERARSLQRVTELTTDIFLHGQSQDVDISLHSLGGILPRLEWKGATDAEPPKPTEQEITRQEGVCGKFVVERGLVLQRGAHNSLWIRVGCILSEPWARLYKSLIGFINVLLESADAGLQKPEQGDLFVAISVGTVQAIDVEWLSEKGFSFYTYAGMRSSHAATTAGDGMQVDAEFIFRRQPVRSLVELADKDHA